MASYKNLIVGVALLSSPQETYITYLAVKPGWDNAQIATYAILVWDHDLEAYAHPSRSMLYHLISLNPRKDITLHVSVNNPAVVSSLCSAHRCFIHLTPFNTAQLLYNRFGFKAEEFIVGFYEDYLDPLSRESKNAFRLRLRQF